MIDPITVSVLTHRFEAIVQEMGEAMLRTAYSQILNSSRDFSTAICDNQARLVAQAEHVPIHVGADAVGGGIGARRVRGPRPARRRLPAQRSLSRQQPPARPHGLRAGVRRGRGRVLVGQPRAPERHRRLDPRRLQPRRHRDLAGGHPHHAAQALRRRRAARRRAADDHDQRAPPARLHGRPARHDRLGPRRRAPAARAGRRLRRQDGDRRGRRDPRRRRAPGARLRARPGRTASTAASRSSTTTATAPPTSRSARRSPRRATASSST